MMGSKARGAVQYVKINMVETQDDVCLTHRSRSLSFSSFLWVPNNSHEGDEQQWSHCSAPAVCYQWRTDSAHHCIWSLYKGRQFEGNMESLQSTYVHGSISNVGWAFWSCLSLNTSVKHMVIVPSKHRFLWKIVWAHFVPNSILDFCYDKRMPRFPPVITLM